MAVVEIKGKTFTSTAYLKGWREVSREAKSDEGEKRRLPPNDNGYQIQQKVRQLKEKGSFLMVENIHFRSVLF